MKRGSRSQGVSPGVVPAAAIKSPVAVGLGSPREGGRDARTKIDGGLSRGDDTGRGRGTDRLRSDPNRDQRGLPSPVARGRPPGPGGRGGRLAYPAWGTGTQPRPGIEAPRAVEGSPCRGGLAVRTGRATGPRLDLRLARP